MTTEARTTLFDEPEPEAAEARPGRPPRAHRPSPRAAPAATARRLPTADEMAERARYEADREGYIDGAVLQIARGMFETVEGAAASFGSFSASGGPVWTQTRAGGSPFLTVGNATGVLFTLEAAEFGARLRRLCPFPPPVSAEEAEAVRERRFGAALTALADGAPAQVARALGGVKASAQAVREIAAALYSFDLAAPAGEQAACEFVLGVLTAHGLSAASPACRMTAAAAVVAQAVTYYREALVRAGLRPRAPLMGAA